MDYDCIVTLQSVLVNTKESILPVCNKPYHKKQGNVTEMGELENLLKDAFSKTVITKKYRSLEYDLLIKHSCDVYIPHL